MRLTYDHSLERLLVSNTRSDLGKVGIGSIWMEEGNSDRIPYFLTPTDPEEFEPLLVTLY